MGYWRLGTMGWEGIVAVWKHPGVDPAILSARPPSARQLVGEGRGAGNVLWQWVEALQVGHTSNSQNQDHEEGAVPTPFAVARLMAELALPDARRTPLKVLDAGCGSARLLAAVVQEAQRHGTAVSCHGIEKNPRVARWSHALAPLMQAAGAETLQSWKVQSGDFLRLPLRGPGYDVIISNPPYVSLRSLSAEERTQLRRQYKCVGQTDLAALFVQRMIDLLRPEGRMCIIVPNKLLVTDYATSLRNRLFNELEIQEIHDLADSNVFPGHGAYPVIISAAKKTRRVQRSVRVFDAQRKVRGRCRQRDLLDLPKSIFPLGLASGEITLLKDLLGEGCLAERVEVRCGIAISGFGRAVGHGDERILLAGDIAPFQIRSHHSFERREVRLPEATIRRQRVRKIVIPGMFKTLRAAYDAHGLFLGRVYYVPLDARTDSAFEEQRCTLLALLNSTMYAQLYRGLFAAVAQAGGYLRMNSPYLKCMPWPRHNADQELQNLVRRLERRPSLQVKERLDAKVNHLFGLPMDHQWGQSDSTLQPLGA